MKTIGSLLLTFSFAAGAFAAPVAINSTDFGIKADGVSDDGPIIRAMLEEATKVEGPVELIFPQNKVIAVTSGTDRYVFNLERRKDLTINGRGSEFRLDPHLRFMDAFLCERLVFRDLKVDYLTQPTAPGTIVAIDPAGLTIDVQLDWTDYASKMGGATREDGEQAFFGMVLMNALYGMTKVSHFFVFGAEDLGNGLVRIKSDEKHMCGLEQKIQLGKTWIGLPVPRVAHRHGPGALFRINGCTDVVGEKVEVWSAPWFAFQLFRNAGKLTMDTVNVRPRPGSNKVLSSCRDAFHAKGNRAEMLFDGCILTGLGDDAFNLATHCSRVQTIHSPKELEIRQHFPIQYIPMRAGDTLVVMDPESTEIVGESKIESIREIPANENPASIQTRFIGTAPTLRLKLTHSLPTVEEGMIDWARETANPDSIVRNCTIRRFCRFQTNTRVIGCDVEALMWFYGATVEGPGPEYASVERSVVKSASLGTELSDAVSMTGWQESRKVSPSGAVPRNMLLKQAHVVDNEVWGKVKITMALEAEVRKNTFPSPEGKMLEVSTLTN